jgi:hypothetical protein
VAASAAADMWADTLLDSVQGLNYEGGVIDDPARSDPNTVLGAPDNFGPPGDTPSFFSLGNGGYVVVQLPKPVGGSLEIYEATWGCNAGFAAEAAYVSVSADGDDWTLLGVADNKADKECYNGNGFMTSFDLAGQCIQYVMVQDTGNDREGKIKDGFDVDAIGGTGADLCILEVEIDIKPGSYPNSVNFNGSGVIPVAFLGSADFDVSTIDPTTLTLEGLAVLTKKNGKPQCSLEDTSGANMPYGKPDGYLDLVCKFEDSDIDIAPGNGYASISGYLYDGTEITGIDEISVRGSGPGK